jgi:LysR family glycine cleavage system transcriptional activator
LRAFEVAARHLSFTHAADELCVTQGAISRSVKALEDYLGESLFERTGHGLALTERSEALALKLSDGFSRLAEAADEFRGVQQAPVLTVRTYTSFLIGFLIPNLPDFQVRHPDIKVHLVSATDSAEFAREQADVRIRYGRGHWKNVESTLLFHDEMRPVCSPALLDPAKRPYPVSELARHVLLHQELRRADWPDWLAMVGAGELKPRDNLVFDELSVVYQAAIAGVGMVMAQSAYFRRELKEGRLFEPFDPVLTRDLGYYLTIPSNRCDCVHVRLFKRWLIETLARAELGVTALPAPRPAFGFATPPKLVA